MGYERVDFHVHTIYSKDSLTDIDTLLTTCRRKRIDRLVITDHNSIAGGRAAYALDPQRIIIGEEIQTSAGELLGIFVQEWIPPDLTPMATIQLLRAQGAFISVSHPFDRLRGGAWQLNDLLKIVDQVDAIEIFNARCLLPGYNHQAQIFAQQHALAGTVGSDAHAPFEIGRATLWMEHFNNPEQLKVSIRNAQANTRLSGPWVHFASRYYAWQKKRSRQKTAQSS